MGLITLGVGYAFSFWVSWGLILICMNAGANIAFILGRTYLKNYIDKKLEDYPKIKALEKAITQNAWKVVFLVRLSPLFPFSITNYMFGTTNLIWWHFTTATGCALLPESFLYAFMGSAIRKVSDQWTGKIPDGSGKTAENIAFYGGIIVTIISVIFITIISRNAIKKAIEEADKKEAEGRELEVRTIYESTPSNSTLFTDPPNNEPNNTPY